MDFIKDDINKLYSTFLRASILSALMVSIYSFVDTIAVGQAEGPTGTAAMAIITAFFGTSVFVGLICGIGGSIMMSGAKAHGEEDEGNEYFTATMILLAVITVIFWVVFVAFQDQIFTFFGADATTLPMVKKYTSLVTAFSPVFILPIALGAFVRNDGAPGLATASVLIGGGVNIFGDWFFVFPMGLGIRGAGIATVIGNTIQAVIIVGYFFSKRCGLKFRKPAAAGAKIKQISAIGVGAGLLDLGTVVTALVMNNQLMRYGGTNALALYGAIATLMALFQSLFSGVGQAIQPLVSSNYAVREKDRINGIMKLAARTIAVMTVIFFAVGELFPKLITRIFMDATDEVLALAPMGIRLFFIIFLFLGVNVLCIYYLQSVLQDKASMTISVLRSMLLNSVLMLILPIFFGLPGVFIAMPISEVIVMVGTLIYVKKIQGTLYAR